jgi:c-di-GMP phosphodiesterase
MNQDGVFIGRQPILDRQYQVLGYELFFRASATATAAQMSDGFTASMRVLTNLLMDMGTEWVLGDKFAFLNVNAEGLSGQFLDLVPPERVVLELDRNVPATEEIEDTLAALQSRGFTICLDNFDPAAPSAALLPWAGYVKLDQLGLSAEEFESTARALDPRSKRIIAARVETKGAFQAARRLDIKYFQGYYFARPETLGAKAVNPSMVTIIELLRLTRENAHVTLLEAVIKRDPTLLFKLLRYVSSPAIGLRVEIRSFRHALSLLGYDTLYKWLSLLLVTAGASAANQVLARTALTRAFMAETLAETAFSRDCADDLFMVGAFSLLDVMLETPTKVVLDKISLPPMVRQALLERSGAYAPMLGLIEYCEQQDFDQLAAAADQLKIPAHAVNEAHLSALAKVEQLVL